MRAQERGRVYNLGTNTRMNPYDLPWAGMAASTMMGLLLVAYCITFHGWVQSPVSEHPAILVVWSTRIRRMIFSGRLPPRLSSRDREYPRQ